MARSDGRKNNELRKVEFQEGICKNATASVLSVCGDTEVICSVCVVPGVPGWMKAQGVEGGWLTSEYSMLPGSTHSRNRRENKSGPGGRSSEIQRLIGRSIRSVVDLKKIGANTIYIDCDVLNADGGTRCASINGASTALQLAFAKMIETGELSESPMSQSVAAISVGVHEEVPLLDLCYVEDSAAEVDMNVIMSSDGTLVEVQGTAEGKTFSRAELNEMLDLAEHGINQIFAVQKQIIN
ncbi:MAG: ribonuclease PH [Lentisphaeraceae bacterium]|nr:ribonuclease PH [Lentisphaeraceae bacterium]